MTSQSPRIYIYKITFEEVLYYYYGVHKEKKFGEYYMGSPHTHKWCWDFYTPKKQILELFDFTDEGYNEAQEIEKRLITPFLDDKWCLNENVGGVMSLEILRKNGKVMGDKFGGRNGKINGRKIVELGVGIHGLTVEERTRNAIKGGFKGAEVNRKNGTGLYGIPTEKRKETGRKSSKKTNIQKWVCLETGYITTSGPLTHYQKVRGIDPSKRKRIE